MKRVLIYAGLVAFLLTWPLVNLILKNDAFRLIGGWSFEAFTVFIFIYAFLPVFILSLIDYFLARKKKNYDLFFQNFIFIAGAGVFWAQLVEHHFVSLVKEINFPGLNSNLHLFFLFSGLIFIFIIYRMKKYLPVFLKILSPLMLIALIALFVSTFQTEKFYSSEDRVFDYLSKEEFQKKRVYFLVFDGISLPYLMKDGQINDELFPNFYRISKEWTWYRNATTNGTSTTTARPMMFSGRYYGDKLNSFKGFGENLFQLLGSALNTHFFFDIDMLKIEKAPVKQRAFWLNKALFISYLNFSIPSPLGNYLGEIVPKSWNFSWRGETPKEYLGREQFYYGKKIKEQFYAFTEESVSSSDENEGFFLLWSVISHFPYVFDKNGEIAESSENQVFETNMAKEDIEKVEKNYIETLRYVDFLLGSFIEKLKEKNLYQEAIIFVVSDHGVSRTGSSADISQEVFRIPFFLKAPMVKKGINDRDVQTIDLTPTILDILGAPLCSEYHGQSLLRPYQEREKIIYVLGIPGFWVLKKEGFVWQRR